MSWMALGQLLRERAAEARAIANGKGIDDIRSRRLTEYLRDADQSALYAWIKFRQAQDLEEIAAECDGQADNETTINVRPPRR
jgi:hypothetical protein